MSSTQALRIPSDQAVRDQALDPRQSFLIQAPAGSGKTELLTDRILALLATVDQPEDIVAITFTRKAATEMHARVLSKLRAGLAPPPAEPYRRRSWELAQAAMRRDAEQGWHLLQHPVRLGIHTIDAYCARLVRAMPWLSTLGGMPRVADDARVHYQAAARATLDMMDDTPAVAALVEHLDVNLRAAETLIAAMLASRDQWLPLLHAGGAVETLIAHLQAAVCRDLDILTQVLPVGWSRVLAPPLRSAAQTLSETRGADHVLVPLADWDGAVFAPTVEELPRWHALAHVLLTDSNTLRKRLDVKLGFPPKSAHKAALTDWLDSALADAPWLAALAQVRTLPAGYSAEQLETLRMLLDVLRLAAAQLWLRFAEVGEVDFIEIAQRADAALGQVDAPSDLLLKLDARIRHILVDEFQDTSQTQIDLLLKLTSGWQAGDGRTLLLVGDPMQSIYRFRRAEVGWFLRVKQHGLGELPLTALKLTCNFRSRAGVVDWINRVFAPLFPPADDPLLGAIAYTPSEAFQPAAAEAAVHWHPIWTQASARGESGNPDEDAGDTPAAQQLTLDLARQALARNPDSPHPVAILVRARSHLEDLARRLAQAGIACRAVELERLHARPVVSDLAQLARALAHPADRLAWLSLLRSPLCGLTLQSLHALAGAHGDVTIPALLRRFLAQGLAGLEAEEAQRMRHAAAVLLDQRNDAGLIPFAAWVEACWKRLGGELAYPGAADRADVEQVLQLIETIAPFGALDAAQLEEGLQTLYAAAGTSPRAVDIMTMHKAKGLEFETVILLGLHRRPRGARAQLLHFEQSEGELLLGPIARRVSDTPDPVSQYLARREQQRNRFEADRLLYVAATRARQTLHLVGEVRIDADGQVCPPAAESLLGRLWDYLPAHTPPVMPPADSDADTRAPAPRWMARLPLALIQTLATHTARPTVAPRAAAPWQPEAALERASGTVAHAWLERLGRAVATMGEDAAWDAERIAQQAPIVRRQLARAGVAAGQLDAGQAIVLETLTHTLSHARGRWLLSLSHARREWELLDADGRVSIMDLAAQDASGWLVVDYKTGVPHADESVEAFATRMHARYQDQIARYCAQVSALDGRPARGALYFPRADVWVEVGGSNP